MQLDKLELKKVAPFVRLFSYLTSFFGGRQPLYFGSGSIRQNVVFIPPNHPLSPAPLETVAPRSHFAKTVRSRIATHCHCEEQQR